MKTSRPSIAAMLAAAVALTLSGCAVNETGSAAAGTGGEPGSGLSGTLSGIGASSMATAQEAWVAAFQTANPEVTVNYSPEGSVAGRQALAAGGTDFAGSDRAMGPAETTANALARSRCDASQGVINLPVHISPIAIIYQIEGVDDLRLDADALAGIFTGTIHTWNDAKIAALNPDAALPAQAITAVHRSDESGTTYNLTAYLHAVAPSGWTHTPSGRWPLAGGEAAPQTSGVVDAVASGTGTIGYADASKTGDLTVAEIKVGNGYAKPTAAAAAFVVDESRRLRGEGRSANDWSIELNRHASGDVYPIVLLSYAVACQRYTDPETAAKVRAYLSYIASNQGQQAAAQTTGMAPLPSKLSEAVAAAAATIS